MARKILTKRALGYYGSAANAMSTLNSSDQAFSQMKLRTEAEPVDFEDSVTTLFGQQISSPLCITSTAF